MALFYISNSPFETNILAFDLQIKIIIMSAAPNLEIFLLWNRKTDI